jgi:transcriptional regulator
VKGIVGLELPIRELEGKWKVSQNRTERERNGVVDGLAKLNTPESLAMESPGGGSLGLGSEVLA